MNMRVYNFSAGPSTLPESVIQTIKKEFLNYKGIGASIVEISHRLPIFQDILDSVRSLFCELTNLPSHYKILFMHGGAQMQFSAVPLNLLSRNIHKGSYFITGRWGILAEKEAQRYGKTEIILDGKKYEYLKIPEFDKNILDSMSSYAHLTTNNTLFGTRWHNFPDTGDVPLVADATSDILSREIDYSNFGVVYAGLQKNLGISGTSIVIIREDLIGHALPETPKLLNYEIFEKENSLPNTINVFAIYVMNLMIEWIKEQGGVLEMEKLAIKKSELLYDVLDNSDFYKIFAHPEHRSIMNVTFNLNQEKLLKIFLNESEQEGFFALRGHNLVGGVRASIYNAMPVKGVKELSLFMKDFERKYG